MALNFQVPPFRQDRRRHWTNGQRITEYRTRVQCCDGKCGPLNSDHFLMSVVINFSKFKTTLKEITYCKLKGIDIYQMIMDMYLDDLKEFGTDNMNNLLKEFEDHIINAMDIHVPSKTIMVQVHDKIHGMFRFYGAQKISMRKQEQIWR